MAQIKKNNVKYWEGIGRRKTTTARVRIYEDKNVKSMINDKPIEHYFNNEFDLSYILKPFAVTETKGKFTYTIKITGGGITGWKDAIRLGIARALVKYNESFKPVLRKAGLLTRDPRAVERKKPGLKKARKAPRFSKR